MIMGRSGGTRNAAVRAFKNLPGPAIAMWQFHRIAAAAADLPIKLAVWFGLVDWGGARINCVATLVPL
jgi:hypothetical protein